MKTIEIISGEQKAQFTTKSVTFGGKEYFYSNMTDVTDHTDEGFYTFTYGNETMTLPYQPKDAKILYAIFSQVQNMASQKKQTAAGQNAPQAPEAPAPEPSPAESAVEDKDVPYHEPAPQAPVTEDVAPAEQTEPAEHTESAEHVESTEHTDVSTQNIEGTDAVPDEKAAKKAEKERLKAEKQAERQRRKAEKAAEKQAKKAAAAGFPEGTEGEASAETASQAVEAADPEKKQKVKKSLIIFGIIVAAIAVLSLIYFVAFGTHDDPTPINPSSNESQTYDDIDELINDLQ